MGGGIAGPPGVEIPGIMPGGTGIRPGGTGLCPGTGADGPILVGWGKTGVGVGIPGAGTGGFDPAGVVPLALDEPGSCRKT